MSMIQYNVAIPRDFSGSEHADFLPNSGMFFYLLNRFWSNKAQSTCYYINFQRYIKILKTPELAKILYSIQNICLLFKNSLSGDNNVIVNVWWCHFDI
jgi:hypothetical protein